MNLLPVLPVGALAPKRLVTRAVEGNGPYRSLLGCAAGGFI